MGKIKDISKEITPKKRKELENFKNLSVEEIFIIIQRRKLVDSFFSVIFIVWLFYYPVKFAGILLERGVDIFSVSLVFILSLIPVFFVSILLGLLSLVMMYLSDKLNYDCVGKSHKILKRIKR